MNNYALKKILPRIIIVAILINLSFIISQVLIDISNLAGAGIYSMFDSISSGDTKDAVMKGGEIVTAILAASAAVILGVLFITVPVFLAMLLAILITMVIIVGRQAGIVILTVIAPLAFLAIALPNTEAWFNKWRKMYIGLLLVYPTVALLFAGGKLTSVILANSSQGLEPPDSFIMQVVAMGVAVIPLIMLPSLLKGSMNSLGAVGTKLGSIAGGANKRIRDKMGSTSLAGSYKKQLDQHSALKRAQIQAGVSPTRNPFTQATARANRGVAGVANRVLPGRQGSRVAAAGSLAAQTTRSEDYKAQQALQAAANGGAGLTTQQLSDITQGRSTGVAGVSSRDPQAVAAAMAELSRRGEYEALNQAWDYIAVNGDQATRNASMDALSGADGKPAYFGAAAMQSMREGATAAGGPVTTSQQAVDRAIMGNAYSAESLTATSKEELLVVADAAHRMHGSHDPAQQRAAAALAHNATTATTNNELNVKIGKNVNQIGALAGGTAGPRNGQGGAA